MSLVVWGRHTSSNVQKVLWGCAEMGVDFTRHDMGGKHGYTDEYLAMNPNRYVPTIDDGGFVLWESNACLRYLARKYDRGALWPDDPQVLASSDRWMDWQQATLWPALRPAFHHLHRLPADKRDAAVPAAAAEAAGEVLRILDAWLAGRKFVAGDNLTIGDIPLGIVAYSWFAMDIPRVELPHLRAWYERLCARAGYARHVMIDLDA